MSAYPDAFREHLSGSVTTLCYCWRVNRTDGSVLGFTDHDRPLTVGGTIFEPGSGLSASEARRSLGLSATTMDVEGALSSDVVTVADIEAGLYDGARVEVLLVNWANTAQSALLHVYTIGAITRVDGQFRAELQNLADGYERSRARYYRRLCDARLGRRFAAGDVTDFRTYTYTDSYSVTRLPNSRFWWVACAESDSACRSGARLWTRAVSGQDAGVNPETRSSIALASSN